MTVLRVKSIRNRQGLIYHQQRKIHSSMGKKTLCLSIFGHICMLIRALLSQIYSNRIQLNNIDSLKHTTLPTPRQAYTSRIPMSHNQAHSSKALASTRLVTRTQCPASHKLDSYEPMEKFCFWLTQAHSFKARTYSPHLDASSRVHIAVHATSLIVIDLGIFATTKLITSHTSVKVKIW